MYILICDVRRVRGYLGVEAQIEQELGRVSDSGSSGESTRTIRFHYGSDEAAAGVAAKLLASKVYESQAKFRVEEHQHPGGAA